ncbi:hypothetical protein B0E38_02542 [Streptomyces sp. 111WW2]|uniref:hypothetical protein n=1 Tax=unclassified Streptomyces TaxID=2593676 RepID=UPI000D0C77B5|nr:hypothetical protein [Streptomyces sp. 111WW2]PSK57011.1 hypothetical protein B0E38_02542 [Streptomyces sp. 111WW2]
MSETKTVNCYDIQLDNGENLKDLGEGNYLELDQAAAGLAPGTWLLLAYEGDFQETAVMRRLSQEEIKAARFGEAFARIYE